MHGVLSRLLETPVLRRLGRLTWGHAIGRLTRGSLRIPQNACPPPPPSPPWLTLSRPSAPADATTTHPDRRDAAPGQTLTGSLRISRTHAPRPRRCHRDPSRPPGCSPPAEPGRVVARFANTRPPPPPMPPRPIPTAGMQPLADPGRVVAHFANTRPPLRRCHRDASRPPGRSPWQTLAGSLRISRKHGRRPADATATHPDRRDAAPGGPWQGRCAFYENTPAAPADAAATHPDRRDAAPGRAWQDRCAFREHTPAAPADATATHPDRRDAAPGRPSQGRCAFREKHAHRHKPAATHHGQPPSRPPVAAGPIAEDAQSRQRRLTARSAILPFRALTTSNKNRNRKKRK